MKQQTARLVIITIISKLCIPILAGVKFKEDISLTIGNNLNATGASTVAVNTNTANNTPDAVLTIDQLSGYAVAGTEHLA